MGAPKMPMMGPQCACSSCTIFTDDFATDRLGTDYTTVAGSFTNSSGTTTTTSANALIVENTAGTTGHGRVTITGQSSASGGVIKVIGSYVDSNNYLFGELTINGASSTWKLFKRVSPGTNTQLGPTVTFTASTATNYTICISWDGTYAVGVATISAVNKLIRAAYTATGNKAGFGTGANSGTITFDNFTFAKNKIDDSACATCGGSDACGGSFYPFDGGFEFNLTGMNSPTPSCCGGFDGLYVIPYQVDRSGAYTPCTGAIDVSTDPCFGGSLEALWAFATSGTNRLKFRLQNFTGTGWVQFGITPNADLSTHAGDAMTREVGGACEPPNTADAACTITSI